MMIIEIDDKIVQKCGIDDKEALELLAVAIYKTKKIHGSLAGKILGISEFEFHQLLSEKRETINYDVNDLVDDVGGNDLM